MILITRRRGSRRASSPVRVAIERNVSGDGMLTLLYEDGTYMMLEPETEEEMKLLLSEAHIIHHNWSGKCK